MANPTIVDISQLSVVLKEMYEPPLREQLNQNIFILQRIAATEDDLVGLEAYVPLHVSRSGGGGSRAEKGTLPVPSAQGYDKARYNLKYHYWSASITGPAIQASKNDRGAFLRGLQSEMDGIRRDGQKDLARQLYGTGDGVIAAVGAAATSSTITLTSNEAILKGQIYQNMRLDIGTVADPDAVVANAVVQSADPSGPTIVIDSAPAVTTAHRLFRQGNALDTGSNETTGLQQIITTTPGTSDVVGQITADSTKTWWQNVAKSVTSVSQDAMQQLWGRLKYNDGEPSLILGSPGMSRMYFNTLQSQVRYDTDVQNLAGGFKSLDFNGASLVSDYECPWGRFFYVDEAHLNVYSPGDFSWLDQDGQVLKWVQGPAQDAWICFLYRYLNLGTDRRNVHGVLYLPGGTDVGF